MASITSKEFIRKLSKKKTLKLHILGSHDIVYLDFNDFRCVYAIDGITSVFVRGQELPIQVRESVEEVSSDIYALYE